MHATKILNGLDNLRREATLCDVLLQAPAGDMASETAGEAAARHGVWAHRAVLAAASTFFLTLFTCHFKESMEAVITIQVDPAVLQSVVEFIYSPASLMVTAANAVALLKAASYLDVGGLRDAAAAFLERALQANNVLGIRALAELYDCVELTAAATRYINQHFELVLRADEFLELLPDALEALLDSLTVPPEEHLLDAVLQWAQHRPQERRKSLGVLLGHVRLSSIPPDMLTERACAEPSASAEHAVQRQIIKAHASRLQPRASALLVVGGWKITEYTRDVLAYELSSGRWQSAAALPEDRYQAGVAMIDNQVHVVGGFSHDRPQSSVFVLDVSRGSWTAGPSLCSARWGLAVAELGGRLYAAGGQHHIFAPLSSVEALDPREGVWQPVARMATGREGFGAATLGGRLYAAGGYDGRLGGLNIVERYDPSADRWEPAESMAQRRSGHGVVAVDDTLYVVGGWDGSTSLRSVERYRVGSRWEPAPSMTAARCQAAVTTHAGRVYVAGGVDEREARLSSVAVFDPATAAWSELPAAMPEGRAGAVAVVVDWPPPAP